MSEVGDIQPRPRPIRRAISQWIGFLQNRVVGPVLPSDNVPRLSNRPNARTMMYNIGSVADCGSIDERLTRWVGLHQLYPHGRGALIDFWLRAA